MTRFMLVLTSLLGLFLFSCSDLDKKEQADEKEIQEMVYALNVGSSGCLELIFPINLDLGDNNIQAVNSWKELKTAFKENATKPNLVFPIDLSDEEGEIVSVNSMDELKEARKACNDKGGPGKKGWKKHCFKLVFPLSMTFPDSTVVSFENRDEMRAGIKAWYQANPSSKERPDFVYPIQVIKKGETDATTIANRDEMRDLKKSCFDFKKGKKRCFKLVFPVSMTFPDGTTATYENRETMHAGIKTWYEANPTSKEKADFVYPVQVIKKGETDATTIANRDEMRDLKKSCYGKGGKKGGKGKGKGGKWNNYGKDHCFEFVFPLNILFPDGTTSSYADGKALRQGIRNWKKSNPGNKERPKLVFPVKIKLEGEDKETLIEDRAALRAVKEAC